MTHDNYMPGSHVSMLVIKIICMQSLDKQIAKSMYIMYIGLAYHRYRQTSSPYGSVAAATISSEQFKRQAEKGQLFEPEIR